MTLDMPFPMQKSDIEFAYHRFYEMMRLVGGPSGVLSLADFQVTQKAAGANMSADVLGGYAWVLQQSNNAPRQVMNRNTSNSGTPGSPTADWLTTFTAAHATLPRIDRVVVTIRDGLADGGANYDAVFQVVPGTATAGATLVNLTGAAAVPANSMLLANVLVPAAATTITTANIDSFGDSYNGGTNIRPRYDAHRFCHVMCHRLADVTLAASTPTDITLDTEAVDDDGQLNIATDAVHVFARTPAHYMVRVKAYFNYHASGGWRKVTAVTESGGIESTQVMAVTVASQPTNIEVTIGPYFIGGSAANRWVNARVEANVAAVVDRVDLAMWCVGNYP